MHVDCALEVVYFALPATRLSICRSGHMRKTRRPRSPLVDHLGLVGRKAEFALSQRPAGGGSDYTVLSPLSNRTRLQPRGVAIDKYVTCGSLSGSYL